MYGAVCPWVKPGFGSKHFNWGYQETNCIAGECMNKELFMIEVKRQLRNIFDATATGHMSAMENKYRCEGFMKAGVVLGVTSNQELAAIMEAVHYEVYGESISERKHKEHSLWEGSTVDYGRYDSPSYERV